MLDLSKIKWPIFPLHRDSVVTKDSHYVYIRHSDSDEIKILDILNPNIKSLAIRRLKYDKSVILFKKPLFKLKNPIFRFSDIFHALNTTNKFIDNTGLIFTYIRTKYYPLIYHKIEKFIEVPVGYLVKVKDIHCKFLINREPRLEEHYIGLLHIDKGYVLYELSDSKKPTTRRMF